MGFFTKGCAKKSLKNCLFEKSSKRKNISLTSARKREISKFLKVENISIKKIKFHQFLLINPLFDGEVKR